MACAAPDLQDLEIYFEYEDEDEVLSSLGLDVWGLFEHWGASKDCRRWPSMELSQHTGHDIPKISWA